MSATITTAILLLLGSLAAQATRPASAAADREVGRALATARLTLVEAVQKALAQVPGRALRAGFEPKGGVGAPCFVVEVLAGEQRHVLEVDAGSGAVSVRQAPAPDAPPDARPPTFDFEAPALPAGWTAGENSGAGSPASWRTEPRPDAPAGQRVVVVETKNKGQTYNLLVRDDRVGPDLTLSVQLQAWQGGEDQGGGLLWRAKDANHYYVVRWNPLERNLRLYTVAGGKRSPPIRDVAIDTDPAAWHSLEVSTTGKRIVVRFDRETVIDVEDATYLEAGAVGLWTKADASTRFDALRIEPQRR